LKKTRETAVIYGLIWSVPYIVGNLTNMWTRNELLQSFYGCVGRYVWFPFSLVDWLITTVNCNCGIYRSYIVYGLGIVVSIPIMYAVIQSVKGGKK
jgi:hypothetical protein